MTTATLPTEADMIRQVVKDPAVYSRRVLGNTVYPKQQEILDAVGSKLQIAVRGCHGSGKTHSAASSVLWWLTRYPHDGKVVTIAPRSEQVETIVWPEIRGQYQQSPLARSLLGNKAIHKTHLEISEQCFAEGTTAGAESALQGYHGRHLLLIADEAPGVEYGFFEVLEGARATGHVTLLMLGNPTITGGPFHEAFTKSPNSDTPPSTSPASTPRTSRHWRYQRAIQEKLTLRDWMTFEIASAYTSWWRDWRKETHRLWTPTYSRTSPRAGTWRNTGFVGALRAIRTGIARVLGDFAPQSEDALISSEWVLNAGRTWPVNTDQPWYWGIDVAGPGKDETVVIGIRDGQVLELKTWAGMDSRHAVMNTIRPYLKDTMAVNIDSAGIGYYFAEELAGWFYKEHPHVMVTGVNVGQAPPDRAFRNLRAQVHWNMREIFERGEIGGVTDPVLCEQIQSLRWRMNGKGQIEIESKDEMLKRGIPSPDRADALMLCMWPAEDFAAMSASLQ